MIWDGTEHALCLMDPERPAYRLFVEGPCRERGIRLSTIHPGRLRSPRELEVADTVVASPAMLASLLFRGVDFRESGPKRAVLGGSMLPAWMIETWPGPEIVEVLASSLAPEIVYARDARREPAFRQVSGRIPGRGPDDFDFSGGRYHFRGNRTKMVGDRFVADLERYIDSLYPEVFAFRIDLSAARDTVAIALSARGERLEGRISAWITKNLGVAANFRLLSEADFDYAYGKRVIAL